MRKSKRKASKRKVCQDRLSELPDSLIHEIFSLLPMRDVVRTTLLSKRWKDLWTTIPHLHFLVDSVSDNNSDKLRNFVSGALALWKGAEIPNFTLRFRFDRSFTSDVIDSWLLIAIEKQVEKLYLNLLQSPYTWRFGEKVYFAPQRLYVCSSIRELSLRSCQLKIDQNVQWNQLKSLTIFEIFLSERDMDLILSGAPRLEVLDLAFMDRSEDLNIRSTSLKMLKIHRFQGVLDDAGDDDTMLSIWSPNLETLDVGGVWYGRCLLNVPSLTNAIISFSGQDYFVNGRHSADMEEMVRQFFLSIRHVRKVTFLSDWFIKVLLVVQKKGMLVPVSNATFLELSASPGDEILGVFEMFPKLMVLILRLHEESSRLFNKLWFEVPSVVKFDANIPSSSLLHLRTIDISILLRDTSINPVIEFVLQNAVMLEKMVFRPISDFGPELMSVAEEKVLSFPRASPTAEVIIRR